MNQVTMDDAAPTDPKERLVAFAERLMAERGPEVPLRDIALAAGHRNNSAVQYYFGSREGLIDAVVDARFPALEARRFELLADHEAHGDANDLRVLIACLALPMLELPMTLGANHFCRFLEQVRNYPAVEDGARLAGESRASVRIVLSRLERAVGHLPAPVRHRRLLWMSTAMLAFLADHERTVESGLVSVDDTGFLAELTDVLSGLLTADSTVPGAAAC